MKPYLQVTTYLGQSHPRSLKLLDISNGMFDSNPTPVSTPGRTPNSFLILSCDPQNLSAYIRHQVDEWLNFDGEQGSRVFRRGLP